MQFLRQIILIGALIALPGLEVGAEEKQLPFAFPMDCEVGKTCFLQNTVDLDPGPGRLDSFCGQATYDGHKGIDIRVPTLREMNAGVDVLAIDDGVVVGTRDEMADELVTTELQLRTIKGRECGNGLIVQHENGWSSQYCHMMRGSVVARKGQVVKRGQVLGQIGVSGRTQFPHLHLTLRKDNQIVDPLTGLPQVVESCRSTTLQSASALLGYAMAKDLKGSHHTILSMGLSGELFKQSELVDGQFPSPANGSSDLMIGWGWVSNLKAGDRIKIVVEGEDGAFANQTSEPVDRSKAQFLQFAGRRRSPEPGIYDVTVSVLRDGAVTVTRTERFTVEP